MTRTSKVSKTMTTNLKRAAASLLAAACLLATAAPAAAQDFVKVDEAARENIPAVPFVGLAYGFIWVALLGYVLVVARRMARLRAEMDELRRRLGDGAPPAVRGR